MTRIIYICLLCLAFQEALSQDTLKYPLKWVNKSKLLNSSSVDKDGKTKRRKGFSFTAEYKFIDEIDTKDLKVFRVLTLQQTKTFTTDFTKTIYKISELEYHTSDNASKKWLDSVPYSITSAGTADSTLVDNIFITKNAFTPIPQIPKKYPAKITLEDKDYVFLDKKKMLSKYRSLKYPRFYLDLDFGLSAAKRFLLITQTQVSNYNPVDARRRNEKAIFSYGGNLKIGVLNGLAHSAYFEYQLLRQGFSGYELDWNTGLSSGTNRKEYTFISHGIGIGYSYSNYRKIHSLAMDVSLTHHWVYAKGGLDQAKINDKLISGKFALGYKRRIGPDTDLRIMPTLYTNFKAINKIDAGLNTSLFNLGLSVGIRQYICQKSGKSSSGNFPKIVSEVKYVKLVKPVKSEESGTTQEKNSKPKFWKKIKNLFKKEGK